MRKHLDSILGTAILLCTAGWIYYSEYYIHARNLDLQFVIMIATLILALVVNSNMFHDWFQEKLSCNSVLIITMVIFEIMTILILVALFI